jgi:sec-independent protein translocase protein TatC
MGPGDDDESLFDRVSVLARLDELRRRLIAMVLSLLAGFVLCFTFSKQLYAFLMTPIRAALPPGAVLVATRVPEVFVLHLQMSLFASVFLVAPFWLWQLWKFLGEVYALKRSFLPVLFLASALFVAGVIFGHFVMFPYAVHFLTTVGSPSTHVMLSVGDLFSFYAQFVLGLGAAFQIPTVVLILSMLGLVTPRFLVRQLRIVTLVVFTIAAILTPTPDLVTQSLLALPMMALYLGSIGLCWLITRK